MGKPQESSENLLHDTGLAAYPEPRCRCYTLSGKVTVTGRSGHEFSFSGIMKFPIDKPL